MTSFEHDWLPVVGAMLVAVVAAVIGFGLALQQDKRRWVREKRAELYIDMLSEAYAEVQWINETTRPADDRFPASMPDTRMSPAERVRLGARATAYATPGVTKLFNEIGRGFMGYTFVPHEDGDAIAQRVITDRAFAALEDRIKLELGNARRR